MLRAAEIFEWLSHSPIDENSPNLTSVSASLYQLAGYPARALAVAREFIPGDRISSLLRTLLQGNFEMLLSSIQEYWGTRSAGSESSTTVVSLVGDEFARVMGILYAYMRWGDESRLDAAMRKLKSISRLYGYSRDDCSAIVARAAFQVVTRYCSDSLRARTEGLFTSPDGRLALESYVRQAYRKGKSLAWPSQVEGIARLSSGGPFALFTPTGSGKTTVAELAILQGLFGESVSDLSGRGPLVLYLVPSRALATEVEFAMGSSLRRVAKRPIIVTGLYGGTDWGPTDVWATSDSPTVLICTYEKAEALVRFLGSVFRARLVEVILDEAHSVEFNGDVSSLASHDNRALKLESLMMRLLAIAEERSARVIALSAVAGRFRDSIAQWIAVDPALVSSSSDYHSTRRLVGRLECSESRHFRIELDTLDGSDVAFGDPSSEDRPYVPDPVPPCPSAGELEKPGPESGLRPMAFWAALHLASPDSSGRRHSVLVAIPQHIEACSRDLLDLLDTIWVGQNVPDFFRPPTDKGVAALWQRCLLSVKDHFGEESTEYRLLKKGVVVHHGSMPGVTARTLIQVIQAGIVNLVLATSTLTDGVNLPFETILIPTLRRSKDFLSPQEFANLSGRAGRPGFAIEGRTLVVMGPSSKTMRNAYQHILDSLGKAKQPPSYTASPLASLIKELYRQWASITGHTGLETFLGWLEVTAPQEGSQSELDGTLDSLDALCLASLEEIEQLEVSELGPIEVEERIKHIWQCTYAAYVAKGNDSLPSVFIKRTQALRTKIYKDRVQRRRLYRTSLPPREGRELLGLIGSVRQILDDGSGYARMEWSSRLHFIQEVVSAVGKHRRFALASKVGRRKVKWIEVLSWWLAPTQCNPPPADQVSAWHRYVNQQLVYKFNWGLGAFTAVIMDEATNGGQDLLTLKGWRTSGLPWITFWLKELITWGTLEPVAAYLMSRGYSVTRNHAEKVALQYYSAPSNRGIPSDEILDPARIRDWVESQLEPKRRRSDIGFEIPVRLLRGFPNKDQVFRVFPVGTGDPVTWCDFAGFPLAEGAADEALAHSTHDYDFLLVPRQKAIQVHPYLGSST